MRFVILALVWGSSFLWIKIALGALSPVQLAVARLALGAGTLIVLCLATRTRLPNDRRAWLRIGLPALLGNAVPFVLFGVGERTVSSGVAGVLNATTPLWALLIALVIRSERRPGWLRLTGLLLGFAGTLVIFAPWQESGLTSWGALACLIAALSYAISYTYIGRYLVGTMSPIAMSGAQLSLATGLTVLALPVGGLGAIHVSGVLPIVAVAVLGICGTGIAFVLNNRLIADEGATTASSVGYLLPVVSVGLGALALHEPLSVRVLIGMIVVLVGIALSRRKASPAPVVVEELAAAEAG
ncbi:MAG TPA: DMT family transporter [Pseudonocardiaceae bacterium]|nr:DMT family transporter [Pseudonocardiaceae bacterium]